jgi:hypothetical protein
VGDLLQRVLLIVYAIGDLATFLYLTFFDGYAYTAWNWIIAVPVNVFLATIWPLYWSIIRWIPSPFG